MFHATARALRTAADQRLEGAEHVFTAEVEDVDFALVEEGPAAPGLLLVEDAISPDALEQLHMEFRWAESKLMQSVERLTEAQEARRKDLVALACMRRDLRLSFAAERAYVRGQMRYFAEVGPKLRSHELELHELVEAGAPTATVIRDLANVRAERKFFDLAVSQAISQIARIDDSENTLEYEVANEAYDKEPDGRTMRELARLRSLQTRAHRAAIRLRNEAASMLQALELDTTFGEITAVGSFLAAEFEGDTRAHARVDRLRTRQIALEVTRLPEPASPWKAGLLHPVSWMKARRMPTLGS